MNNFCITGEEQFKCKEPTFLEFENEIPIMITVLEYFKRFLPRLMSNKLDCYNKQINIDPKDIDVILHKEFGDYVVVLVPTEDTSSYLDDNFTIENSEYSFELQFQARDSDPEGSLQNLILLKSGIKTMLVNMDVNLGLNVEVGPCIFDGPFEIDSNKTVRTGSYKFTIKDSKIKK